MMSESNKMILGQQDIAQLIQDWRMNIKNVGAWQKLTRAVVAHAPNMQELAQEAQKNIKDLTHICLDALRFENETIFKRAQAVILAHMKTHGVATAISDCVNAAETAYCQEAMSSSQMWRHIHWVCQPLCKVSFSVGTANFKHTIAAKALRTRKPHFAELNR